MTDPNNPPSARRRSHDTISSPDSLAPIRPSLDTLAPRESFQRVRFSIEGETSRPPPSRRGSSTALPDAVLRTLGPGLEAIRSHEADGPESAPPPPTRKRGRGYSLRRQLFSRNVEQEQADEERENAAAAAALSSGCCFNAWVTRSKVRSYNP